MLPQTYAYFRQELAYRFWLSGAVKSGNFTLRSGEKSNLYIDCKQVAMHGPTLGIICKLITGLIGEFGSGIDSIGGMEFGAVPLISAFLIHNSLDIQHGFIIRKETKSRIIGTPTNKCILIEDVITTGSTIINCIEALGGIQPIGIVCIVNRSNKKHIEGYPVKSIFNLKDIYYAKPGK